MLSHVAKRMMMQLGGYQTYSQKIVSMFGANLIGYWPMDEAAGADAINYGAGGAARNGAYTAVTLGQPGIGDGKTCPAFDGTNSFCDIYSAGFSGAFNPDLGSIGWWCKIVNLAYWTGGNFGCLVVLQVDGGNYFYLAKSNLNNLIDMNQLRGGGTNNTAITPISLTAWFHLAITWSHAANETKVYLNGAQYGVTTTCAPDWAGALAATGCVLGAVNTTPAQPWAGWMAHAFILDRVATDAEILKAATV